MKKIGFVVVLIMVAIFTGCSFNPKIQINNLKDAYLYLSEMSANKEIVSIEGLKKELSLFKVKYIETKEIAIFEENKIEKIDFYEIIDSNYFINLMINENRIVQVNISNKDKNTGLEYSGFEELIYLEEEIEGLNEIYLTSEINNIEDFDNISKMLDKSLKSELFSKFNLVILNIKDGKNLNIEDIEKIIGFEYNDKKLNSDSNESTYIFSDSRYEINAVYSENDTFDSVYLSHDIENGDMKIGLAISYNKSENTIQISIRDKKDKSELLRLNTDFMNTFLNN